MGRFDDFRRNVAELIDGSRDEEPEPRGYQQDTERGIQIEGGLFEHDPDRDLDDYWDLYENLGIVQQAIDNYASEVIEPGWYITADSDETVDELTEYFRNVAILNTRHDVSATQLMEAMVRERDIKGTIFLEKVTDSKGRNQALYPLDNDTITIYTKPGKAMLPAPDDDSSEPIEVFDRTRGMRPTNDRGETGAYVQYDDIKPIWDNAEEVVYTRDEVIKWVRDAEIGDARGSSRVETIYTRATGLLQKLQNNDDAIESKAWPQIIFNMGTEENPWTKEEVEQFMDSYKGENLEPGTMTAVSGDVSTEEFAGETADIADDVEMDINMIMSGMPGPVYATGGWSQNVAPAVAQAQQRQFRKEVKKTRRRLEELFTPYLRETAEQYNLDAPDTVELHVGRPAGEVAPEDVEGSIIRYSSDSDVNQQPGESSNQTQSGSDGTEQTTPGQDNPSNRAGRANQSDTVMSLDLDDVDTSVEEMADPRLVSTVEYKSNLADVIEELLVTGRNEALAEFRETYDDAVVGSANFDTIARRTSQRVMDDVGVESDARSVVEDTMQSTLDTLSQPNHDPGIEVGFGYRHRSRADTFATNIDNQATQALGDMMDSLIMHVRRGAQQGDDIDDVVDRVEGQWADADLAERASIIARMELMSVVNDTKLAEYERHPDVDGIRLVNPCNTNTTPLCEALACDGESASAMFDADDGLGDQIQAQVSDDLLYEGFSPAPPVPPLHMGCRTEIVPYVSDE